MGDLASALVQDLREWLLVGGRLWLFLDYDGTLADFARTPDELIPDGELINLMERLADNQGLRVAIVSGRRLEHIRKLLPIPGLILAGTYGIELMLPEAGLVHLVVIETIRPALELIKPRWEALILGRKGFYLEDKGWGLALHARFADAEEADRVLKDAGRIASDLLERAGREDSIQMTGGNRFLEVGSKLADKVQAVDELVKRLPWPGARLVYIGDDDKDEKAFAAIHHHGGTAIVVAAAPRPTLADVRLESPREVRAWLESILA